MSNKQLVAKKIKTDIEPNKELALKIQEGLQKYSRSYKDCLNGNMELQRDKLRRRVLNCKDSVNDERLKKDVEVLKYFYMD